MASVAYSRTDQYVFITQKSHSYVLDLLANNTEYSFSIIVLWGTWSVKHHTDSESVIEYSFSISSRGGHEVSNITVTECCRLSTWHILVCCHIGFGCQYICFKCLIILLLLLHFTWHVSITHVCSEKTTFALSFIYMCAIIWPPAPLKICYLARHLKEVARAWSTTTDRLMFHELFHAGSHAHTRHHVHRALYTIMYLFYDKRVVHMCIYTSNIAFMHSMHACSCIYSMFSVHASTNICACRVWDDCQPIDWCSMNCFHASIHAHIHHHVHRTLYTLTFFFYEKLVHKSMYTFTIACMYSLHAFPCIRSIFSVHAITNICASFTTSDRLMFHELFPCTYSCAYSSLCAHMIVHSNGFILWQTCSAHVYLYFHRCLFMYSLHILSACKYQHPCVVYDSRSTDVPWIVSMYVFMRILVIMYK